LAVISEEDRPGWEDYSIKKIGWLDESCAYNPASQLLSKSLMFRCCIVYKAGASPDLQLRNCGGYQAALYCSGFQKKNWRKQHKQICKLLNVGHGGMQLRNDVHTLKSLRLKERFERGELRVDMDEDMKGFFKLFEESTVEGSRVAVRKMREFAERQIERTQKFLVFRKFRFSSSLLRQGDAFVTKQSTSRVAPMRRSQRAVWKIVARK
jgi:hypothetical protein